MPYRRSALAAALFALTLLFFVPTMAQGPAGMKTIQTGIEYGVFYRNLKSAVRKSPINILFVACAHCGAKSLGVTIRKNNVFHVYGPHFAVRMLEASVAAGFEAPLRLYTTEQADGTAALTYRLPTAAFAPYGNADIDAMAEDLDAIFEQIVQDALNG
ncbi:MAG: DUF302 domain-containing protein [Alphaproteobacteria bacterium]|nr:DUF302 domain-containing protein [Alphaproteobacteria bacterium]